MKKLGSFTKFAIIATLVFAVYICFISRGSVLRWIRANMHIEKQEKQISDLEADIAGKREQLKLLQENRDSLEKFARENFHFAAPGEDVYVEE